MQIAEVGEDFKEITETDNVRLVGFHHNENKLG